MIKRMHILEIDLESDTRLTARTVADFFSEPYQYVELGGKHSSPFLLWGKSVLRVSNFEVMPDNKLKVIDVGADVEILDRPKSKLPEDWEKTLEFKALEWVDGTITKLVLVKKEKEKCVEKPGRKSAKGAGTSTRKSRTNTATCSETPQKESANRTLF